MKLAIKQTYVIILTKGMQLYHEYTFNVDAKTLVGNVR